MSRAPPRCLFEVKLLLVQTHRHSCVSDTTVTAVKAGHWTTQQTLPRMMFRRGPGSISTSPYVMKLCSLTWRTGWQKGAQQWAMSTRIPFYEYPIRPRVAFDLQNEEGRRAYAPDGFLARLLHLYTRISPSEVASP